MLEGVLGELLQRYLELADGDGVALSFRDGRCAVGPCSLRPAAWQELALPARVESVRMQALEAQVHFSWSRLGSRVELSVRGLDVRLAPHGALGESWDAGEALRALLRAKRRALDRHDQERRRQQQQQGLLSGWAQRLLGQLLESAVVRLVDSRLLLEDRCAAFGRAVRGVEVRIASLELGDDDERAPRPRAPEPAPRTVRKRVALRGLEVTLLAGGAGGASHLQPFLRPCALDMRVRLDRATLATEVALEGHQLQLVGLSPEALHGLHAIASGLSRLESWVRARQQEPRAEAARAAGSLPFLRWAAGCVLRRVRLARRIRGGRERYLELARSQQPLAASDEAWLDAFILACPLDTLLAWARIPAAAKAATAKAATAKAATAKAAAAMAAAAMAAAAAAAPPPSVAAPGWGWREWLNSVARQEIFASAGPAAPRVEPELEQPQQPSLIATVQLPRIHVALVDDHGFPVCDIDCGVSAAWLSSSVSAGQQFMFNLDSLLVLGAAEERHGGGADDELGTATAAVPLLQVRRTLAAAQGTVVDAEEFFSEEEAEDEGEDELRGRDQGAEEGVQQQRRPPPLQDEQVLLEQPGEQSFLDASGGDDELQCRPEQLLSPSAPVRLRWEAGGPRAGAQLSLVAEPLEIMARPDALARLVNLADGVRDLLARPQGSWPEGEGEGYSGSGEGEGSERAALSGPRVRIRVGAPTIGLYKPDGRTLSGALDLGHLAIATTDGTLTLQLTGVRALALEGAGAVSGAGGIGDGNGNGRFHFSGASYVATLVAGPVDVTGSVEAMAGVSVVTVHISPASLLVSGRSIALCSDAVRAAADTRTALRSLALSRSGGLGLAGPGTVSGPGSGSAAGPARSSASPELRLRVAQVRVVAQDGGARDLCVFEVAALQATWRAGRWLNSSATLSCVDSGTGLRVLAECTVAAAATPGQWTLTAERQLDIVWLPALVAELSANLLQFTGGDEELASVSTLLHSKVGALASSAPPLVHGSLDVAVQLRAGLRAVLHKDDKRLVALELGQLGACVRMRPPRRYELSVTVVDATLRGLFVRGASDPVRPVPILGAEPAQDGSPLLAASILWAGGRSTRQPGEVHARLCVAQPIRFVMWQPFMLELSDYLSNGIIDVLSATASSALLASKGLGGGGGGSSNRAGAFTLTAEIHAGLQIVVPATSALLDGPCAVASVSRVDAGPAGDGLRVKLAGLSLHTVCDSLQTCVLRDATATVLLMQHPGAGLDEPNTRVESRGLALELDRASLALLMGCLSNNLLSNTTMLEALLSLDEEAPPGMARRERHIRYWKHLLKAKMEPQSVLAQLHELSLTLRDWDGFRAELASATVRTTSHFVPEAGFQFTNEYALRGLSVRAGAEACWLGSRAHFPWHFAEAAEAEAAEAAAAAAGEGPQMGIGLRAANDPRSGSLDVKLTVDNVCLCASEQDLRQARTYVQALMAGLEQGHGGAGAHAGPASAAHASGAGSNSSVAVYIEVVDTKVLVPQDPLQPGSCPCLEGSLSVLGNATSRSLMGRRQLAEGVLHVTASVSLSDSAEPGPLDRAEAKAVPAMAMTMTESMLLSANGDADRPRAKRRAEHLLAPLTFDIRWDLPYQEATRTQQVRVALTSELALRVTGESAELLSRLLSLGGASKAVHEPSDEGDLAVLFAAEPLGLKLGPCPGGQVGLEVRGFGKECEELVTRTVRVGDVLTAVEHGGRVEALVSLPSLDEVKQRLRAAEYPLTLRLRRRGRAPCDLLQYMPVAQNVWTCRVCAALQPLSKRSRPAAVTCTQCGAFHTDYRRPVSAEPLQPQQQQDQQQQSGAVARVESFENQRFYLLVGWSASLLPADPFPFSDHGGMSPANLEDHQLPRSSVPGATWQWTDTWTLERSPVRTDEHGWLYAKDFSSFRKGKSVHAKPERTDCVRRRRWVRHLALLQVSGTSNAGAASADASPSGASASTTITTATTTTTTTTAAVVAVAAIDVQAGDDDDNDNDDDYARAQARPEQQPVTSQQHSQQQLAVLVDSSGHRVSATLTTVRGEPLLRAFLAPEQVGWARLIRSEGTTRLAGNAVCAVEYFNLRPAAWEPLLEPWSLAFELLQQPGAGLGVTLLGINRACINLTIGAAETLARAKAALAAPRSSESQTLVRNLTAHTLSCGFAREVEVEVPAGATRELGSPGRQRSWQQHAALEESLSLSVFGGWRAITGLPLVHEGRTAYALDASRPSARVVVDVAVSGGSRLVTLSSLHIVRNATSLELALSLDSPAGARVLLGPCPAGSSLALPIAAAGKLHLYLRRQGGERHGAHIALALLEAAAGKACAANLSRAVSSSLGVAVERSLVELGPGLWVLLRTVAHAVENCVAAGEAPERRLASTPEDEEEEGEGEVEDEQRSRRQQEQPRLLLRRRAIVGARFSTVLLSIEASTLLVVTNELPTPIHVRVRARNSSEDVAREIAPGALWHVEVCDDPRRFEWTLRVPCVGASEESWSGWAPVLSALTGQPPPAVAVLRDAAGHVIALPAVAEQEDAKQEPTAVRLRLGPGWVLRDLTGALLQAGLCEVSAAAAPEAVAALPAQALVKTVVARESERWSLVSGWGRPSLPRDPHAWSVDGHPTESLAQVEPLLGHRWAEPEWRCGEATDDKQGWLYASDFQASEWRHEQGRLDVVRCRVWRRACVPDKLTPGSSGLEAAASDERTVLLGGADLQRPWVWLRAGGSAWASTGINLALAGEQQPANSAEAGAEVLVADGLGGVLRLALSLSVSDRVVTARHRFTLLSELDGVVLVSALEGPGPGPGPAPATPLPRAPAVPAKGLALTLEPGRRIVPAWRHNALVLRVGRRLSFGEDVQDEREDPDGPAAALFWTGEWDPAAWSEQVLHLRRAGDLGRGLLRVRAVAGPGGTTSLVLSECRQGDGRLQYRVENRSLHAVTVCQSSRAQQQQPPVLVSDRRVALVGLDDAAQHSETVFAVRLLGREQDVVLVDLANDAGGKSLTGPSAGDELVVLVYSEGATRVLCVSHAWAVAEAPPFVEERAVLSLRMELAAGLTLSLVGLSREIATVHAGGAILALSESSVLRRAQLSVQTLAVDDADPDSPLFAVLRGEEGSSFLSLLATAYARRQGSYRARFKFLSARLGDLRLQLNRHQVRVLTRFLECLRAGARLPAAQAEAQSQAQGQAHGQVGGGVGAQAQVQPEEAPAAILVDALHFHPCAFRLTLDPWQPAEELTVESELALLARAEQSAGRSGRAHAQQPQSPPPQPAQQQPAAKVSALRVVSSAIARVTEVDQGLPYWAVALDLVLRRELRDQRIHLKAVVLAHCAVERWETLADAYRFQLAAQMAGSALVSSETLRLPARFARALGKRVVGGGSERGLVDGTAQVSEALLRGLARGLATMSMSSEYVVRRREGPQALLQRPDDLLSLLTQGASIVRDGVAEGMVGLVAEPYSGARSRGTAGLVSGLGKGVVGAALKPVVGLLDAAALASLAVQSADPDPDQQQQQQQQLGQAAQNAAARVRSPRALYGAGRLLRVFDAADAQAAGLLRSAFRGDRFCGHVVGADGWRFLLSAQRVAAFDEAGALGWSVRLASLHSVQVTADSEGSVWGVHLRAAARGDEPAAGSAETASRFIRCGKDRRSADAVFDVITKAVREASL